MTRHAVRAVGVILLLAGVAVLAPTGDAVLTLTTCHPKYSDRERLVVTAALEVAGN